MAVSPPFAISETLPLDSDLISNFPGQEHPFRDTVESWLAFLSDPATGLLRPTAFPTFVNSWVVQALDVSSDAIITFKDSAGVRQSVVGWDHTLDVLSLIAYADDGTTVSAKMNIKGDAAVIDVATGALQVAGNAVVNVTSAVATAITGTGALNAGSITSGFGGIDIGADPLTAGAASFASMASSGAVSGTTGSFSGAVTGAAGTFSGALTGANVISSTNIFANPSAATMNFRPSGPASTTGQMTLTASGTLTAAGDITASSDRRLKKSISPLGSQWANETVREVQPMTFLWNKNDRRGIGFIAQDVQAYAPELVYADQHGMLSLAYPNMVAILWKVVQDLQDKVVALEAK